MNLTAHFKELQENLKHVYQSVNAGSSKFGIMQLTRGSNGTIQQFLGPIETQTYGDRIQYKVNGGYHRTMAIGQNAKFDAWRPTNATNWCEDGEAWQVAIFAIELDELVNLVLSENKGSWVPAPAE